ncbi:MAG: hypothetical protein ABSD20_14030 [Terriglobales bacterium]|jgi:hypothetical protein
MANLPKSVLARVARWATPDDHPDADWLNAFCENTLMTQEREAILAHLAECRLCRDIVSLVNPDEGPPVQVAGNPGRAWMDFAFLPASVQWGAVAAAVALMILGGLFYRSTRATGKAQRTRQSATGSQSELARAAPGSPPVAPPVHPSASAKAASSPALPQKQVTVERPGGEEPVVTSKATKANHIEPAPNHGDDLTYLSQTAPAPVMNSGGGYGNFNANGPALASSAPATNGRNLTNPRFKPNNSGANLNAGETGVANRAQAGGKAAPAGTLYKSTQASTALLASPSPGNAQPQREVAKRPQTTWSISQEGKLMRGVNNGVPEAVEMPGNVDFFALAAVGEDVWAAGAKGALFHSVDDGVTWHRLSSPSPQDLVSIEFSDHHDGIVTDADNTHYSTHDGGQSWQKLGN